MGPTTPPVVTIAATDAATAEAGPNTGTGTITRTGDLTFALVVTYTIGGTATNEVDYTTIATSLTIPVGRPRRR